MNEEVYNAGYQEGARLNPLPDDVGESCEVLRSYLTRYAGWDHWPSIWDEDDAAEAATFQILEHLGVL